MNAGALKTDMTGLSYKPAWLDHIVQVTATTNHENSLKNSVFEGYFRRNPVKKSGCGHCCSLRKAIFKRSHGPAK
jgi:hypothetical protein